MKTIITAFSILLFSLPAFSRVSIKDPGASEKSYRAFNISMDYTPYAKSLLDFKKKPSTESLIIEKKFKEAMDDFLSSSLDLATLKFQDIIKKAHSFDWNENSQKFIYFSFIRLYQLTKEQTYLQRALSFNPKLSASEALPPPELKIFNTIKKNMRYVNWKLDSSWEDFSWVLINGRPVSLRESVSIKLPEKSTVRLTFLSNSHHSFTRVLDSSAVPFLSPNKNPLVSGNCKSPKTSFSSDSELLIFFSKDCTFSKGPGQMLTNRTSPGVKNEGWMDQALENPDNIMRKKWIWASLVAATVFYLYKKDKRKVFEDGAGD